MYTFIISLIIVVAILLVLIVLAQNPKGGGLSSQFGGSGSSSQMMGVKRTTDLLEKLTWGFAIALVVLTLSSNLLLDGNENQTGITSPNIERAQERGVLPNLNAPSIGQDSTGGTLNQDIESLTEDDSL